MDQIQTIRIFIRVVELGSFSKAGEDMGIGQSSVTKRIAQLEERLGTRLLFRSTHGVTPTEVGERYYEKCKVIIRNVEEADSIADLMQSGVVGTLRVSCSVAFGRRVLLPLIIDFMHICIRGPHQ